MATTDAKSGFRLPWSSDRPNDATDDPTGEHSVDGGWPSEGSAPTESTADDPAATMAAPDAPVETAAESVDAPDAAPVAAVEAAPAKASGKKPNKFLADLTKAMQAAAEDARGRAVSQLQADAKTHVETIHARSATEAADLRRNADDDVAAVREWSKAEIARVREETEQKITDRKGRLEKEIEHHAAVIEREIEAVQGTVAGFEAEMAAFFERLLAEEDPTRFATMAENLPEPPSFDDLTAAAEDAVAEEALNRLESAEAVVDEPVADSAEGSVEAEAIVEGVAETVEATDAAETGTIETDAEAPAEDVAAEVATDEAATDESGTVEAVADETGTVEAVADETTEADATQTGEGSFEGFAGTGEGDGDGEVDREAAFAAIQAAAEAAASAEVAADAAARAEAVADVAIEIIGNHDETEGEADPRYAALGLTPDFDAAEAEALASAEASGDDEIPVIGDDALAARLAGLVPTKGKGASGDATHSQVIVTGLVSVASIASFKRHLGRVAGVQSVGVSSGPEGEFIFAVTHAAETSLRDAIPSLPSFQARVTGSNDNVVNVTAHDPEADG